MRNDYEFQMNYVRANAQRILDSQDVDPLSPSFGCLHAAYWRDKTSEFPDSRFQEGAAVLALLLHPRLRGGDGPAPEALRLGLVGGLRAWLRQQHPDGSFDEWYKGEHGFAATAFGTVAFGLSLHLLGDAMDPESRSLVQRALLGSARWLARHDDLVKTNHQAAGAAALALAGRLLEEPAFLRAARAKHESVVRAQTGEGWFPEVGGADLGYTFLLVDSLMLYRLATGDDSAVEAAARAYAFAAGFLRPDLSLSTEAGLCGNGYVSRLGTLLLADRSPEAARVLHELLTRSAGATGLAPYLSDDLRFFRWGSLPLAAWVLLCERQERGALPSPPEVQAPSPSWTTFPRAGLMIRRTPHWTVELFPASGGLVRVYPAVPGMTPPLGENRGLCLRRGGAVFTTAGYDPTRPSHGHGEDEAWTRLELAERRYVLPGLLMRLGLRVACTVPWLSYRVRALIDRYRIRNRTAGNQSATARAARGCGVSVLRLVDVRPDRVTITDRVRVTGDPVLVGELAWLSGAGLTWLADLPFEGSGPLPLRLAPGAIHAFHQEFRVVPGEPGRLESVFSHAPGHPE